MTESEASTILKAEIVHHPECSIFAEALGLAIQALEKQIPKKPNKTIDSSWGTQKEAHTCPVCDYYLTEVHFIEPQKIESNKKIKKLGLYNKTVGIEGKHDRKE